MQPQKCFTVRSIITRATTTITTTATTATTANRTEQISEIKKGLDLNKLELSESERLLAEQDNEFKEQCNIRKDAIIKLNQLKEAKREIEQN